VCLHNVDSRADADAATDDTATDDTRVNHDAGADIDTGG
jgi:hypothetical protein